MSGFVFFIIVVTSAGWACEPQTAQDGSPWSSREICESVRETIAHSWEEGYQILVSPCVELRGVR